MSTMTLLGRIGRDVELRYTPGGDAICNIAVAYNYGRKGQDGKKPSQWVDATLFGKRAEALVSHLVKGQQVALWMDDVHVRTYQKNDGTECHSLSGTVQKIEFAGSAPQQQQQQPAQQRTAAPQQSGQTPGQRARQPAPPPAAFDDFDDDIPF